MPKTPDFRQILAGNLRTLMARQHLRAPALAERAGVDPKTINNILRGAFRPRLDIVDKLAHCFSLSAGELLTPGIADRDAALSRILDAYSRADDTGRHSILSVAELAARSRTDANGAI